MSEHNPICLSLPAVVAADYKTEGSNEMMGDLDVCRLSLLTKINPHLVRTGYMTCPLE